MDEDCKDSGILKQVELYRKFITTALLQKAIENSMALWTPSIIQDWASIGHKKIHCCLAAKLFEHLNFYNYRLLSALMFCTFPENTLN
jgi:hypothetical protein